MAQIILDSNNNLIQGDFDNATLNNRTKLQTTTTNATTNVYVVPNGSSTSAGVSVANNSNLTNASKIVMATNGTTDTQIISGVNGSGTYLPLSFYTNNALAMQLTTGGIISAAGGGIQFPATQIPSADANTLDDYEEGTWTPNVGGTATYTIQAGSYVKIGKLVLVRGTLRINTIGTGATNNIKGLPFSTGSDEYTIPVDKSEGLSVSIVSMALRTSVTDLYANYRTAASASSNVNGNFLQNSTEMQFTGCYIALA